MIRIPTHRAPTHPGEMLLEEFLNPMGITQRQLADAIHVPYQRVNEIINGKRGVTPATALRLAKFFNLSADYWMNLQQRWDLYHAKKSEDKLLNTITTITAPPTATHLALAKQKDLSRCSPMQKPTKSSASTSSEPTPPT